MANESNEIIDLTDIIEQGKAPKNDLFEENLDKIEGLDDPSLDDLLNSINNNSADTNLDNDFDSALNNESSNTPYEPDELDELDALLASKPSPKSSPKAEDDQDLFSELDDLIAETQISPKKAPINEISLDDLDELLGSATRAKDPKKASPSPAPTAPAATVNNDISIDDLDELLNSAPKAKASSASPKAAAPELDLDDLDALLNSEQFSAPKSSTKTLNDELSIDDLNLDDLDIDKLNIDEPDIFAEETATPKENSNLVSSLADPRIDELFAKLEAQEQIITELKAELDAFKLSNEANEAEEAKNTEELEKLKELENIENTKQASAILIAELSTKFTAEFAELSAKFAEELTADLTNLEDKFELYKATSLAQIEVLNTQNANLSVDLQKISENQNNFVLSLDQTISRAAAKIIQEEITAILSEEE